jgi:hypothetical protein
MFRDVKQGDIAWGVILAGVVFFELTADDLLSEATERYWTKHPILTRVVIGAVAGHLAGVIPSTLDLFSAENVVHQWAVEHWPLARPDRAANCR